MFRSTAINFFSSKSTILKLTVKYDQYCILLDQGLLGNRLIFYENKRLCIIVQNYFSEKKNYVALQVIKESFQFKIKKSKICFL